MDKRYTRSEIGKRISGRLRPAEKPRTPLLTRLRDMAKKRPNKL